MMWMMHGMMRVMVLQPHDTAAGVSMPAMHDAIDTSLILWLWSTTRISDLD